MQCIRVIQYCPIPNTHRAVSSRRKVDKVRSPSEAAGSAQFRSIVLTATIKTEGLSAAPLRSVVALMLVFSFSATSVWTGFSCVTEAVVWIWSWLSRLHLCRSPCVRALSHRLACCQRLARHKGEARLNEVLEVPVPLKLGAFWPKKPKKNSFIPKSGKGQNSALFRTAWALLSIDSKK